VCASTHTGSQGIASADRAWHGLASFPGHPGNEARHGHALWMPIALTLAPSCHRFFIIYRTLHTTYSLHKTLEFAKSSSVCT